MSEATRPETSEVIATFKSVAKNERMRNGFMKYPRGGVNPDALEFKYDVSVENPSDAECGMYWGTYSKAVLKAVMGQEGKELRFTVRKKLKTNITNDKYPYYVTVVQVLPPMGRPFNVGPKTEDHAPPTASAGDEPESYDPGPVEEPIDEEQPDPLPQKSMVEMVREAWGKKGNGEGGPNLTGRDAVLVERLKDIQHRLITALEEFES